VVQLVMAAVLFSLLATVVLHLAMLVILPFRVVMVPVLVPVVQSHYPVVMV
jgi:hypothetical protein